MRRSRPSHLALAVLLAIAPAAAPSAVAAEATSDPWAVLRALRRQLERHSPQRLTFVQELQPSGFEESEKEEGQVSLDLPSCVRWDYFEPYPKSFLLCHQTLHSWNPGEPVGHLYDLEDRQPGLDLLRLDVDELMGRYTAIAATADGRTLVTLTPRLEGDRELRRAEIEVDREDHHLTRLGWLDRDGNRTTFRFGARPKRVEPGTFTPPADVEWQRE